MTKAEEIITKVSRDLQKLTIQIRGNGTIKGSILGRLGEIEENQEVTNERLLFVENYPGKNGCLFQQHEKEEYDLRDRKRTFRIGDLANYIQLAVLVLIAWGMFIQ